MHHVAVALDEHQVLHLYRAELADAADIVTAEIDQHDVFGHLFGVGAEIGLDSAVLNLISTPWAGSGDWPVLDGTPMYAHQQLWRGADDVRDTRLLSRCILQPKPQKGHVWRGVYDPQRAINVKSIHSRLAVEPLRQHALKDVSRGDVLL